MNKLAVPAVLALALSTFGVAAQAQSFTEGFDSGSIPEGWVTTNNSAPPLNPWNVAVGITNSAGAVVVLPQAGPSFAIANFTSLAASTGTISNWLISPEIFGLSNGASFSFYTTTAPGSQYPDALEFRLSRAGASVGVGSSTTSVGDFSTLLLSVNPGLAVGGYPEGWTRLTATVSGLAAPVDGRVAFRYFVTNGGAGGSNSNIIGVDSFSYVAAVPEPASWALALCGVSCLLGWQGLRRRAVR